MFNFTSFCHLGWLVLCMQPRTYSGSLHCTYWRYHCTVLFVQLRLAFAAIADNEEPTRIELPFNDSGEVLYCSLIYEALLSKWSSGVAILDYFNSIHFFLMQLYKR